MESIGACFVILSLLVILSLSKDERRVANLDTCKKEAQVYLKILKYVGPRELLTAEPPNISLLVKKRRSDPLDRPAQAVAFPRNAHRSAVTRPPA
jgi:hypothetical protein